MYNFKRMIVCLDSDLNSGKYIQKTSYICGGVVYEIVGRASGMVLEGIGEVGERAIEGHAAGVYGAGFAVASLTGQVEGWFGSDKELIDVKESKINYSQVFVYFCLILVY